MVGKKIPQFGIFGDTVNTASRMASTSEDGEIQVSENTYSFLKPSNEFVINDAGVKWIKGKGDTKTFWLKNYEGYDAHMPIDCRLDRLLPKDRGRDSKSSERSHSKKHADEHDGARSDHTRSLSEKRLIKSKSSKKKSDKNEEAEVPNVCPKINSHSKMSIKPSKVVSSSNNSSHSIKSMLFQIKSTHSVQSAESTPLKVATKQLTKIPKAKNGQTEKSR